VIARPPHVHSSGCPAGSACRALRGLIEAEGAERLFPPLDGTAFYPVICHINHSCEPNVAVNYAVNTEEGLVAQMHALRDISDGEELLQSYIDQTQSKISWIEMRICC
jgi:hypothetical protein